MKARHYLATVFLLLASAVLVSTSPTHYDIGKNPKSDIVIPAPPDNSFINVHTPICRPYTGGPIKPLEITLTMTWDVGRLSYTGWIGDVNHPDAAVQINVQDGLIGLTFIRRMVTMRPNSAFPKEYLFKFDYKYGVGNVVQNGWYVNTAQNLVQCHYKIDHTVSAIADAHVYV